MEQREVPDIKVSNAFYYMFASIGAIMLVIALLIVGGIAGTQGYSITSLTLGIIGILFLALGGYFLVPKKRRFIILSATSLAVLYLLSLASNGFTKGAVFYNMYSARGSVAIIAAVFVLTFVVMRIRTSLSNKRRAYQTLSLVLFNLSAFGIIAKHILAPGLHCYACPWATAGCPIGLLQNWIIMGEVPYYLLGSFAATFAIVGRAFCGWACPFGYLHDIIDKITDIKFTRYDMSCAVHGLRTRFFGNGTGKGTPKKGAATDDIGLLTYVTRTIIFVAMIIASWRLIDTWFCKLCPAGLIEAALPYRLANNVVADPLFIIRVVAFLCLLLLAVIISRFWCRYFCPLGHLAGHFNRVSLLRLHLDETKCNDCKLCRKACPMELYPVNFLKKNKCDTCRMGKKVCNMMRQEQSNCILCGECVEACRSGALTMSFSVTKKGAGQPAAADAVPLEKPIEYKRQDTPSRPMGLGERGETGRKGAGFIAEEPRRAHPVTSAIPPRQQAPMPKLDSSLPFAAHIHVFYSSGSPIPSSVYKLKEMRNYVFHTFNTSDDEWSSSYYSKYYSDFMDLPVVLACGQLYTGDIGNLQQFVSFVSRSQRLFKDIYITCTGNRCTGECRSANCAKALGSTILQPGTEYTLGSLGVTSLGALLASCPYGCIWATYGSSERSRRSVLKHKVENEYRLDKAPQSDAFSMQRFMELPVVGIDMHLKKGVHTSNEVLNTVAKGSYYSGGKLNYSITESNAELPVVYVNRHKVLRYSAPTSYSTLLHLISMSRPGKK